MSSVSVLGVHMFLYPYSLTLRGYIPKFELRTLHKYFKFTLLWSQFLSQGFLVFKTFVYLLLKRGERKEKERERNISVWLPLMHSLLETWPSTQACALPGNQTSNPLVHRLALNPLSYTSQGSFNKLSKRQSVERATALYLCPLQKWFKNHAFTSNAWQGVCAVLVPDCFLDSY